MGSRVMNNGSCGRASRWKSGVIVSEREVVKATKL